MVNYSPRNAILTDSHNIILAGCEIWNSIKHRNHFATGIVIDTLASAYVADYKQHIKQRAGESLNIDRGAAQ